MADLSNSHMALTKRSASDFSKRGSLRSRYHAYLSRLPRRYEAQRN